MEKLMLEELCKDSRVQYLKNPTDAHNLSRWGAALMQLAQCCEIETESLIMLREAASKLEEALTINPGLHESRWYLGTVYSLLAILTNDENEANFLFDEALQCFLMAVEQNPGNELYRKSVAGNAELRKSRRNFIAQAEAQRTMGGGPAASSSTATVSAKNKSSELKYDICGWVILAVGIVTLIGVAKSHMPLPPPR